MHGSAWDRADKFADPECHVVLDWPGVATVATLYNNIAVLHSVCPNALTECVKRANRRSAAFGKTLR
jgi:hypothetical protein